MLNFTDPNPPYQVTGYNVYRSTSPSAGWVLKASDVVDMDAQAPDNQWVDASPGTETYYYDVTAYNSACPAEGPW